MSKNKSTIDLTSGSISLGLVKFALPLMAGNVLQQCYNLTDTLVVGRFIGKNALAAVGSAYTLMIFLTSIILGLSMGCGAFLSIKYGAKEDQEFAIGNAYSAFVAAKLWCPAVRPDQARKPAGQLVDSGLLPGHQQSGGLLGQALAGPLQQ